MENRFFLRFGRIMFHGFLKFEDDNNSWRQRSSDQWLKIKKRNQGFLVKDQDYGVYFSMSDKCALWGISFDHAMLISRECKEVRSQVKPVYGTKTVKSFSLRSQWSFLLKNGQNWKGYKGKKLITAPQELKDFNNARRRTKILLKVKRIGFISKTIAICLIQFLIDNWG